MSIGARIKASRESLGMSQAELALLAGYSDQTTIPRVEKDEVAVPLARLEKIASALGVSPAYLAGWEE